MRAVSPFRRHPLLVALSVFALLAQLLLPIAHAQAWAQRGGNPLLYAYCGQVSPQVAAALQAQLAQSAIDAGAAIDHAQLADLGCSACASLHAAQLAAPPLAGIVLPRRSHEMLVPMAALRDAAPRQLRLPPSQAPPRHS